MLLVITSVCTMLLNRLHRISLSSSRLTTTTTILLLLRHKSFLTIKSESLVFILRIPSFMLPLMCITTHYHHILYLDYNLYSQSVLYNSDIDSVFSSMLYNSLPTICHNIICGWYELFEESHLFHWY